jgi:hypothetical protein
VKQSRIVSRPTAVESPRHLPLVDLLVDARSELFELAMRSGLKVLDAMLEEDRTALCGPRYAHVTERRASRAGTVSSEVVLGGRKVAVRRPRVRAGGQEIPLPTFQAMANVDPLNRRVVEQMLVGGRPAPFAWCCAHARVFRDVRHRGHVCQPRPADTSGRTGRDARAEIGTCADTLLASIGRTRAAVRAGVFHLAFNIATVMLGIIFVDQLAMLARALPGGDSVCRVKSPTHTWRSTSSA